MSIAWGVLALSLLGAGPEKSPGSEWMSYTVRTVEMPASGWFWGHSNALKLAGRQGTCEIWTGSRATADALISQKGAEVKLSLSDTKPQGCQAVMGTHTTRNFVIGFSPIEGEGAVRMVSQTETVLDGCSTSITAQESAGGIRAKIECTSHWLADVREVGVPATSAGGLRGGTLQLPEVVTCEIQGEWTIPDDGILLISLGTNRPAKKDSELVERVAIVEAHKVPAPTPEVIPASYQPDLGHVRPMPALPDRSLLPAIGPDGKPVSLPPLPDTQVSATSFVGPPVVRPSPQTNVSTAAYIVNPILDPALGHRPPITVGPSGLGVESARIASIPPSALKIDPNVAQARFEPMPVGVSKLGMDSAKRAALPDSPTKAALPDSPTKFDPNVATARYEPIPIGPSNLLIDGAKLASGRPQSLHIPLTDRLAIDVDIKIVPATRSE